jgi:hypothetical protein
MDFLKYGAGGPQPQTGAAIGFRDQDREISRFSQSLHELGRIDPVPVQPSPIVAGKPCAQAAYGVTYV